MIERNYIVTHSCLFEDMGLEYDHIFNLWILIGESLSGNSSTRITRDCLHIGRFISAGFVLREPNIRHDGDEAYLAIERC